MNEAKKKSRLRPLLMIACILFGVPLVMCAGVLTWYFGRQSVAAEKVDLWIEDLSQRGEPVDDESLQLSYQVTTSDRNTAEWVALRDIFDTDLYREATFNLPFHGAYTDDDQLIVVPPPGEPWPGRGLVDAFVKRWQAEIDKTRQLGEAEYVNTDKPLRRPIEFQSVATLLPDTQHVRTMARLMRLEHAIATYDGDQQRAYECIRACLGLERSTNAEPIIVSQLVGQAVARIAGQMMQLSVEHDQLTDEQMDQLADSMPTFAELCDHFKLAMRGERAMILPIFSDSGQAKEMLQLDSDAGANLLTKTRSTDALYYLELMDELLSLPSDDMQSFYDASKRVTDRLNNDARNAGMIQKMDKAMSFILFPAVDAFAGVMVRRTEHDNLAKLAMAVRKFHHKFDRWPKLLEGLSEVGVDAGKLLAMNEPFRFRVEENGDAVVWGLDRSASSGGIPAEPPEVEHDESPNAPWVWRLRP